MHQTKNHVYDMTWEWTREWSPMPNAAEVIGPHRRLDREPGDNNDSNSLLLSLIFGTLKHGGMQVSRAPVRHQSALI